MQTDSLVFARVSQEAAVHRRQANPLVVLRLEVRKSLGWGCDKRSKNEGRRIWYALFLVAPAATFIYNKDVSQHCMF